MTGFRLGYALGPARLIEAMTVAQGISHTHPTHFVMRGALAAEARREEITAAARSELSKRRSLMVEGLRAIEGVTCAFPEGAFYAFANVKELLEAQQGALSEVSGFCEFLLEHGLAVVPGSAFGAPRHIRLSFAVSRE